MDALAQLNLSLGTRYPIEGEIGRGGMATVYRARDIKHNRRVALKVLNPELGAVLGVERFLSEIQVTANLQHPNLLPLFDSGNADGLLYYVMPYVDGESLRARLAREKQLPIDEAIRLASAIASALDHAHRQGVIHRDLKPENILLVDGQPLVADFGIALAVSVAGGDRITQTGLSLGTPQYMSPEQATGDRVIDARTDVYSLGAVTYEMLTGEPPHMGSTAQAIIARVITDPVRSIRVSRPSVPEHVEAAVMCALEKLPADRWRTAQEFADALQGRTGSVVVPGGSGTSGAPPRRRNNWRATMRLPRSAIIAGALVAGSLIAGVIMAGFVSRMDRGTSVSFVIDPPVNNGTAEVIEDFALSHDGQAIAIIAGSGFAGPGSVLQTRAYLRRFSESAMHPIPGTENAWRIAFSPDDGWLAITTTDGKLLKLQTDRGGSAMTLADGVFGYSGIDWLDDETLVLGTTWTNRPGIGRVMATGGPIQPITHPKAGTAHALPLVAPDHKTVLFTDWGMGFVEDDYLAIGSLATGAFQTSPLLVSRAFGVVDGRALYTSGASIMAVPFDAKRLTISGAPVRVIEGVTADWRNRAALSPGGTLAYRRGQPTSRLIFIDRNGRTEVLASDGQAVVSLPFGSRPRLSPDGQHVAIEFWGPSGDTTASNIWTFDMRHRTFARVSSSGDVIEPEWTVDGRRLLFTTWYPRNAGLWMQVADASRPAEMLYKVPDGAPGVSVFRAAATPDGRGVIFCQGLRYISAPEAKLYYLSFSGGATPEALLDEPMDNYCEGRVSPDGRWLAYVVSEDSTTDVYVRPFRRPGGRVRVSETNGMQPAWSRDGKKVFYAAISPAKDKFLAVAATVSTTGNAFEVLQHTRIAVLPSPLFDVAPDGTGVFAMQESYDAVQLVITTNWLPQLRARLAGKR